MLVAADVPEDLVRYLDSKVKKGRNGPQPPAWPFGHSKVVVDTLSPENLQLLTQYQAELKAYQDFLANPRAPRSRSKVMTVLLETAIAKGKLK